MNPYDNYDVYMEIFSYLPPEDLKMLRLVNKDYCNFVTENFDDWKKPYRTDYIICGIGETFKDLPLIGVEIIGDFIGSYPSVSLNRLIKFYLFDGNLVTQTRNFRFEDCREFLGEILTNLCRKKLYDPNVFSQKIKKKEIKIVKSPVKSIYY